jgi:hypothetical protein
MSVEITTAFVEQYKGNMMSLAQESGSMLRKTVQIETITGTSKFIDYLGPTAARKRTSRHSDTPRMDTPHSRRLVTCEPYDWADLIDDEDKVRMLVDPTSEYAINAAKAMGRAMDDEILLAAVRSAKAGVDGSSTVTIDADNVVGIQTVWPGVSAADTGLNLRKLLLVRKYAGRNKVDRSDEIFVPVNSNQIDSLLQDERVISGDYNKALPLTNGEISRIAGCTLVPCERIMTAAEMGISSSDDEVLPWYTREGICMAIGADVTTRISERDDKNYATQVFVKMDIGASRMEEARVGYILCDPGASPTTDA